jgi:S-DNA-T family DNA segregation ATPase FtsK/SpoIIIE
VVELSVREKLKREINGILLVAVAIFLFLCLISYDPADPSLFSYSSQKVKEIHNWMGIVGAYISGFLFQGFGFPSFLIPFALGLCAFSFIFRWEWKYPLAKLGGWTIILLTASSLFSMWIKPLRIYTQDLLVGGFVGEILSRNVVRFFNLPGATILFTVILILGFVLGTGMSFIALIRNLGGLVARLVEKVSTMKMVKREQSERAKKLVKRKLEKGEIKGETTENWREAPPVVVVEKTAPARKKEEIVEQEIFEFAEHRKEFQLPPISLLDAETEKRQKIDRDSLVMNSRILEKSFKTTVWRGGLWR